MIYTPRFIQISSVYLGFNANSCEKSGKRALVVVLYPAALLKYIVIKYQVKEETFILLLNVPNLVLLLLIHYVGFIPESMNI